MLVNSQPLCQLSYAGSVSFEMPTSASLKIRLHLPARPRHPRTVAPDRHLGSRKILKLPAFPKTVKVIGLLDAEFARQTRAGYTPARATSPRRHDGSAQDSP